MWKGKQGYAFLEEGHMSDYSITNTVKNVLECTKALVKVGVVQFRLISSLSSCDYHHSHYFHHYL